MPYIALPHFVGNRYVPVGSAYFGSVGTINNTALTVNVINFGTEANTAGSNLNAGHTGGAAAAGLTKGFMTGGSPGGSYVSGTSVSTFSVGTWAAATALSQAGGTRTQGQAAGLIGVVVCGGFNGSQLNFANHYLWTTMARSILTSLTVARFGMASFGTISEGFFWGGSINASLNTTTDTDKYSFATGAKTALGAVTGGNKIYSAYFAGPSEGYAVGGQSSAPAATAVDTSQKFTYATLATTISGAVLVGARTAARGAANASTAFVAGGVNTSSVNQSTNDKITLATDATAPSTALTAIGAHIPSLSSSPAWA
jgi:hypothetical protein